jgi:dolichol-phosphate mannosyltransferase
MDRVIAGLRHLPNWWQLGRFLTVGASGFAINIAVYAVLVHSVGVHYIGAALLSNAVALTSNFVLNRQWTFEATDGRRRLQAPRFAAISASGFAVNLLVLRFCVELAGLPKLPAEVLASAIAAPVNFLGSRQWAFRLRRAPAQSSA